MKSIKRSDGTSRSRTKEKPKMTDDGRVICPKCGHSQKTTARIFKKCVYCGKNIRMFKIGHRPDSWNVLRW